MIQQFKSYLQKDIKQIKYDFLIVGAGITGTVCANLLADKGYKVLVVEKRPHVAGNCYTEDHKGIDVHMYGAHIFRTSKKLIWDYVNQFHPFHHFNHKVMVKYDGNMYSFPINLMTLYQVTGGDVQTPTGAARYFEKVGKPEWIGSEHLEQHCIGMVGPDLYNIFIKGYTEKQWGQSCSELPSSIVKRIPVRMTWNDSYFDDSKIYQGIPDAGGYTKLITEMLQNVTVYTQCDFLRDQEFWESVADRIIYTGGVDDLLNVQLPWRSLEFKTIYRPMEDFQGVPVVNYTSKDVLYTRIIEHKHFCTANKTNGTVLTYEYPKPWKPGEEKYYPLQDDKSKQLFARYEHEILQTKPKYILAGRLGTYRYLDMDVAIEEAMKTVYTILQNDKNL